MPKVLIAPATLAGIDASYLKVLRDAGFSLVFPPSARQLTEDELNAQLNGIDAAIAGSEPYSRRVLQAHPQLRSSPNPTSSSSWVTTSASGTSAPIIAA